MTVRIITPRRAVFFLASAVVLGAIGPANAASNTTMTTCFEKYESEKDAGTLPKGEIWTKFYTDCAAHMKKKGKTTAATAQVKKTKKAPVQPSPE